MNEITKTDVWQDGNILTTYHMKGHDNYGDVNIEVYHEDGGHGCLWGINVPKMTSNQGYVSPGSICNPQINDVLHVLNQVLIDFNCRGRIVEGYSSLKLM